MQFKHQDRDRVSCRKPELVLSCMSVKPMGVQQGDAPHPCRTIAAFRGGSEARTCSLYATAPASASFLLNFYFRFSNLSSDTWLMDVNFLLLHQNLATAVLIYKMGSTRFALCEVCEAVAYVCAHTFHTAGGPEARALPIAKLG